MHVIIPSRLRPETCKTAARLMPFATVCVGEDERAAYAWAPRLLVHPPEIVGLGCLRNWILDHVEDETVVMVDDDVDRVAVVVGYYRRNVFDPAAVYRILWMTSECCREAGLSVFGFDQSGDCRKFNPDQPFGLCGWVGTAIGVIGRAFRFSDAKSRVDIDYCLQALLRDRAIWVDRRFSFVGKRHLNAGGSSTVRTKESDEREIKELCNRWPGAVTVKPTKTTIRLVLHVERKQPGLAFE